MKKRIYTWVVFAVFALAGCGNSKPNEKLDNITNEISTVVPESETATEKTDNGTSEEEEKYYLTFEATTTEGEAWNSDKFANSKLTMINIWGTYCNPCLAEMPDLGELAAEYDTEEFQLIGIICDVMDTDSQETIDAAKELIEETKAAYPHLLLNESLYVNLVGAVDVVPTTFFVKQDGVLVGYLTGAQSKEDWKILIDRLLEDIE